MTNLMANHLWKGNSRTINVIFWKRAKC